jgi:membrane fusion protein, heavy metal efflux system
MTAFHCWARLAACCRRHALAAGILLCVAGQAAAHEGHDHREAPPAAAASALKPRLALQSEQYQFVAVLDGGALRVFLDSRIDNAPITDAEIALTIGEQTIEARPAEDGTFTVEGAGLEKPRQYEIVVGIKAAPGDDLLIGSLDVPAPTRLDAASPPGRRFAETVPGWAWALVIFTAGLVLGALLRGGRQIGPPAITLGAGLFLLAAGTQAWAHEGHDHGGGEQQQQPAAATAVTGDRPQRLADGSLFVPKPTQRLLEVRTAILKEQAVRPALRLVGRVIADPAHSGLVQSVNGGRIFAPAGSLPRLGQVVTQGEVLAEIEPPIAVGDYSSLAERSGELDQQIALTAARIERFEQLLGTNAVAKAQLEDAKVELEGLQRRRAALRNTQREREVLRAPVNGVIAAANAVAGQVVEARDLLFQVLDPGRFWIEALAFDPRHAEGIIGGHAVLEDGSTVPLSFKGKGRALQQHAAQLHFAVKGQHRLALGEPVTVLAQREATITGQILPKEAVVRGPSGEWLAFEHEEPERFRPRLVRIEPVDGDSVLVLAGLKPGMHIVTRAAEMLNQIR